MTELAEILDGLRRDFESQEFRTRPTAAHRQRFLLVCTLNAHPVCLAFVRGQLTLAGFDVDAWMKELIWGAALCSGWRWRWTPERGLWPVDERKNPNGGKPVGVRRRR